jgi:PAS domain S-box-containing protein
VTKVDVMGPDDHANEPTRAAEQLRGRLELVLDNIRDYGIFMLDRQRCVVSWNSGAERIVGYSSEEIIGRSADIVFTPEDRASGVPEIEMRTADEQGCAEDDRWHLRKDGSRFFASGILTSARDEGGTLLGYVKLMRDITERRRADEALAQSEERYRLLIESISDYAIFMLDPAGRVTSWTSAAERIIGYPEGEVTGRHFSVFFTAEDRLAGVPDREVREVLARGRVDTTGWRVRKDGSRFWGEETATAVHDSEGGVRAISKVIRDRTERMFAEIERERLLQKMTEANRLKDEFLGTVSHELRTPLNSILGWVHLMQQGHLDATSSRQALETVERNARAQARLVEDLLDVSRIVTGQLRLHLTHGSLAAVVTSAIEAVKPAAQARAIAFTVRLDPGADEILADAERLQQVVWNLLSNAIKFTPPGGRVTVTTRRVGDHVEIAVSDTGAGIAPEFLPFVFDRFRQADSTTTRAQAGLGLGLAIVRHLVELHGGHVRAESAGVGGGSTFRVFLPTSSTSLVVREGNRRASVRSRANESPRPAPLSGLKLMVVEDHDDTREMMRVALQRQGAEVVAVGSAPDALAALERARVDILVVDIAMAGRDGYWLVGQLRAGPPEIRNIPAIAVTAHAGEGNRARALAAGFESHLSKPVDLGLLASLIASLALGSAEPKAGSA